MDFAYVCVCVRDEMSQAARLMFLGDGVNIRTVMEREELLLLLLLPPPPPLLLLYDDLVSTQKRTVQ